MALQIQQMDVQVNKTVQATFAGGIGTFAIGINQFGFFSAGGNVSAVQVLSLKLSTSRAGNTLSITLLSQQEPGDLDPGSFATIVIFVFTVADASLNALSTWEGVPQAQTSAAVQTVGTNLTIQETFLTGFHFEEGSANNVNTIAVAGQANVSGTSATVTPQLLMEDASGHLATTATMDASFLQSCDPHPSFAICTGTVDPNVNAGVTISFPSAPAPITQVFMVATNFSATFGSGNDWQICEFDIWTDLEPSATAGQWILRGGTRMKGNNGSSGEEGNNPIGYLCVGLPASTGTDSSLSQQPQD